ncbi:MAG: hypothetical protein A2651_00830 [Candidatus Yanofskybacteria bacterium RIFCSPHIGHO2_01_FULL_42_12]|uniref:HAD family hydrolase n=1 Tax=Candidatus Yanofskybacteria bacterium RIFCSPLOWO2_01_FULL_42_49 TaxID=1802694 RepID=A0A1F8GDR3_9BACT|nr:MAG: hypothetical protein A2651_00830 [Candidatus Yanofskybacteria bacterium RIFCSPHIGHO2_01_FULL_42_12]OGN23525.1 MAG: hypothetical protein A2918_00530 [Candidatus Yanofskybacteria bacterium RIFCSPLOWO2_01_FULL_42_49]
MVEAVFFDCGNVLLLYNTSIFYRDLEKRKRSKIPVHEILVGKYRSAFVDFELGDINSREFFDRVQRILELDMSFAEFIDVFTGNEVMIPDPVILELKIKLKEQGVKLVLVTNNNPVHVETMRQRYPEVMCGFDFEAISYEMHMRKPDDPEIFIRPMEILGLKAENCLLVDDHLPNAEAFRKLGGLGYHYNVRDEFLRVNMSAVARERNNLIVMFKNLGLIDWPEI